jgi:D-alanine-D-alanine ligase
MSALAIGLVYDVFGSYPPRPGDPPDADAEYEPEATVEALVAAIERLGHRAVRVGNAHALLAASHEGALADLDAALSIAEGYGTRNREAWAPVLLDLLGIPCLGSDPLTLSLSLDKKWTHDVVSAAGVPVPGHVSVESPSELEKASLPGPFPLFVKPRWEGTAKGIDAGARVEDAAALAARVAFVVERYGQPALVERFLPGAEYTVTLVGNDPPEVWPVLQRALARDSGIGLHAVESPDAPPPAHHAPGALGGGLEADLGRLARAAFAALRCRDFARADFKLDADGRPVFLEINPLPTFAPDGSFGILAELQGRPLPELLAEVLGHGLARLGLG